MIGVEEDLYMENIIISSNLKKLDKGVASPTKRMKYEFEIITPFQKNSLVSREDQNQQKVDQAFSKSLFHSYQFFP